MTVGAINNKGDVSTFSNYGQNVDVLAPGEAIVSILPEENYIFSNGTSVAAAFVTGETALALSYNNNITENCLKQYICISINKDKARYVNTKSMGRINAHKLLMNLKKQRNFVNCNYKLDTLP